MRDPRHIVITGASSGIGAALVKVYAGPGVTLSLIGRDKGRLETEAAAARIAGASVTTGLIDVTDATSMENWLHERDAAQPVDLVIANAGISAGTDGGPEDAAQTRRILATNMDGAVNTVMPLLPAMRARKRGQVALMASLAGFRGFAGAPAYCASKAALRVWGEALRDDLHKDGVEVCVICPGYVATNMTRVNKFHMPWKLSAPGTAAHIRKGLARNAARLAFPFPTYAIVWALAALPPGLTGPVLRRLPRKAKSEG
ncbi:MAG: SDR family NAD(P)-dependent oxidoreductase [Alphaproteobacteria bacterium]|nr:MAG: SDR family NAD(P)-dependent oxidoreductase [Alphaproteobacteria bacterium]